MTVFIIVAVLLMVGAVLAIVVPLLRKPKGAAQSAAAAQPDAVALSLGVLREQLADLEREYAAGRLSAEVYAQEKSELEQRALDDARQAPPVTGSDARRPKLALAIGLAVPALVLGMYFLLGTPDVLESKPATPPAGEAGNHALTPQQIASMVERLAERLQDNPGDGAGWQMLARSYGVLGRYAESAAAYGRAVSLLPPDAQLLADFADTLAMTQERRLQGQPEAVVRQALAVDPRNVKALALSGSIAFERMDYAAAIGEWRKILAVVPEESNVATSIRTSIADAEAKMGAAGIVPKPALPVAAVATTVSGSVAIDAALRKKVGADDVVFVFARAVEGPRMPLAILRKRVSDLPFEFSLDDSMAMTPNFKLSQFEKLIIGARVSKSGDALPRSGDLEGLSAEVAPGVRNIRISISSELK